MRSFTRHVLAVAALTLALPAWSQNLVTNGSFELPVATPPWQNFGVGSSSIVGWTVVTDTISVLTATCCAPAGPFEGSQYLDLTGPNDGLHRFGGITQSISTAPGTTYILSFELGNYAQNSVDGGTVSILATVGGVSQTFTVGPVSLGSVWVRETMSFVASASTTSVTLLGTAGDHWIGLDSVVVSSVPEPSTQVALLLGLAAVSGVVRRRT